MVSTPSDEGLARCSSWPALNPS